jgi:hypothetical protein
MTQPQIFLLQILVNANQDGSVTYQIRSFYQGKVLPDGTPLQVNVGDRVGWLIQAVIAGNYKQVPYSVTFQDSSFFGTASLNVPQGGPSQFLAVHSLEGKVKYSVIVPGLIQIDPDIQSGDTGTTGLHPMAAPVSYTVSWDTSHPDNTMTYTSSVHPAPQPLPLTVADGDSVTFNATVALGASASQFAIAFGGNGWPSPFSSSQGRFSATGANTTIGPLVVKDPSDAGAKFSVTASIQLNGASVGSSNANNIIVMQSSKPDHGPREAHKPQR